MTMTSIIKSDFRQFHPKLPPILYEYCHCSTAVLRQLLPLQFIMTPSQSRAHLAPLNLQHTPSSICANFVYYKRVNYLVRVDRLIGQKLKEYMNVLGAWVRNLWRPRIHGGICEEIPSGMDCTSLALITGFPTLSRVEVGGENCQTTYH